MSYLFWYKVVFMTELLAAEAMLSCSVPRRSFFPLRAAVAAVVCYAAAFLYPLFEENYTWLGSSLMFFALFCVTALALWACFKARFSNILFVAVTAYAVQHVAYEIFSLLNIVLFDSDVFTDTAYDSGTVTSNPFAGVGAVGLVMYLFVYTCVYLLSYAALHRRAAQSVELKLGRISVIGFSVFVLFIGIVLSAIAQYAMPKTDGDWQLIVCVYNMICCIVVFWIHMSLVKTRDAEYERAVVSELFGQYQKNYRVREESIDLINRKCHDFKYHIRTFASSQGIADGEAVRELSDLISIYDTDIRTGSAALDIILTEKSLLCHDKGIALTCLADGTSISFMKDGEVYALFGNILDNAIEAVTKINEAGKRRITLRVARKGDIVTIGADNYYAGEVEFAPDGLPRTVKTEEGYHGFGMKSIRALAEAYGGTLFVSASGGVFRLSIVFPYRPEISPGGGE